MAIELGGYITGDVAPNRRNINEEKGLPEIVALSKWVRRKVRIATETVQRVFGKRRSRR